MNGMPPTDLAGLNQTTVAAGSAPPLPRPRGLRLNPARLIADQAFAARLWMFVAAGALLFCGIQPFLIVRAMRTRERVVVLDGSGAFSVAPLLGFEEAKDLHETMALWATLAIYQRNPNGWDFPEMMQKAFLASAYNEAVVEREKSQPEFDAKNLHQKPEVFKIEILRTREDRVLVKVQGQLLRTGIFENQTFTESPKFVLTMTFARNPNMAVNRRYPLGVWSYESTIF